MEFDFNKGPMKAFVERSFFAFDARLLLCVAMIDTYVVDCG